MPLPLFYEWQAYARLNPFTEARADWRAAMLASQFSNMMSALWSKRRHRYKIDEFMPTFKPIRKKTSSELYKLIKTYALMSMPTKQGKKDG